MYKRQRQHADHGTRKTKDDDVPARAQAVASAAQPPIGNDAAERGADRAAAQHQGREHRHVGKLQPIALGEIGRSPVEEEPEHPAVAEAGGGRGPDRLEQRTPDDRVPGLSRPHRERRQLRQFLGGAGRMIARIVAQIDVDQQHVADGDAAQDQECDAPAEGRDQGRDDQRGERARDPSAGMHDALRRSTLRFRDPIGDHLGGGGVDRALREPDQEAHGDEAPERPHHRGERGRARPDQAADRQAGARSDPVGEPAAQDHEGRVSDGERREHHADLGVGQPELFADDWRRDRYVGAVDVHDERGPAQQCEHQYAGRDESARCLRQRSLPRSWFVLYFGPAEDSAGHRQLVLFLCVPGATQHEVVRCRPGIARYSILLAVPDQRCSSVLHRVRDTYLVQPETS